MAILFNKEEFIKLLIKKGKEYEDQVTADVELEVWQKYGDLEYLFYVYQFGLALEKNNIEYFIRLDGYPSYMINILGLASPHTRNNLQDDRFDKVRKNQFQFYIPYGMRTKVIELFSEIADIKNGDNVSPDVLLINNKYKIDLVRHGYLKRLNEIDAILRGQVLPDDEKVVNYMLQIDEKGYYMPNLFECCGGNMDSWYSLINVAQPKNLDELTRIVSLNEAIFTSRPEMIKQVQKYGLRNIICCRDEFYHILCGRYDIDQERVDAIRINLNARNHLCESDELLLESNGVPEYIIKQLDNIRFLPRAENAVVTTEIMYRLAYIKFYYLEEYKKLIKNDRNTFVGPFFYINGKIIASKQKCAQFDPLRRFFDSDVSHFDFFQTLNIDGDYGNYPRGRVIFDNFHQYYLVYLDKTLFKSEIQEEIKRIYCLEDEDVIFKKDAHYTHDGL